MSPMRTHHDPGGNGKKVKALENGGLFSSKLVY